MNLYIIKIDNQYLAGFLYESIYLSYEETSAEIIKGDEALQYTLKLLYDLKAQGRLNFKELTIEETED